MLPGYHPRRCSAHVTWVSPQALLGSCHLVITPGAARLMLPGYHPRRCSAHVTWLSPQALLEMQLASKPHMKDGTPYRGTEQMFDINFDLDSNGLADRGETQAFFARYSHSKETQTFFARAGRVRSLHPCRAVVHPYRIYDPRIPKKRRMLTPPRCIYMLGRRKGCSTRLTGWPQTSSQRVWARRTGGASWAEKKSCSVCRCVASRPGATTRQTPTLAL
eukprot:scaffold60068_cov60-Phaeocystis_antarctica.AAC.1